MLLPPAYGKALGQLLGFNYDLSFHHGVIATVLCCLPAGVVAIVYALKVTNKYREGDIEGAKRASETGAWWCIASIVLGIVSMPLSMLIMSPGAF